MFKRRKPRVHQKAPRGFRNLTRHQRVDEGTQGAFVKRVTTSQTGAGEQQSVGMQYLIRHVDPAVKRT